MWIVFGWDRQEEPLGIVGTAYCYDCRRRTEWLVSEESKWAMFSGIRVLRFARKHRLHCTRCGDDLALTPHEFAQIHAHMQEHDSIEGAAIYRSLAMRIEAEQLADKTPLQLKFIRDSIAAQEHYDAVIKAQNERGA